MVGRSLEAVKPGRTTAGKFRVEKELVLVTPSAAIGTVAYMAPEQMIDAKRVDGRVDIFSVGIEPWSIPAGYTCSMHG